MLRFLTALAAAWTLSGCLPPSGAPSGQAPRAEASSGSPDACRPRGLYKSPGTDPPYCHAYDAQGREVMGEGRPRRIVGYFAGWRTGADGRPAYLVPHVPWNEITHLHYAFAHIDEENRISVGDPEDPANPATGMTWPSVAGGEMDPELPYRGHFNLLARYKRRHPHVKTLVSVGGWEETGGYVDGNGRRVASGGFYAMTTLPDGSVHRAGIGTFARSVVAFLRRYGFDGVDIDYEFPTSMAGAGHPLDKPFSEPRRPYLMRSYMALLETLRGALDRAGQEDGRYYMLTAAAPASAYLLRGMEVFQVARYLDYVNVMSYDFHGSWNEHVGHHAPLFDTGLDSELLAEDVYSTPQYGGIGYLNADWAYHYFRGSLPAGRINLGIPYYTRGWQRVVGGRDGLWGQASLPDQSRCPAGTGGGAGRRCGHPAEGIDDLWADAGEGAGAGAGGLNPLWHARNLEEGIQPSYLGAFGLNPAREPEDGVVGDYVRRYDDVAEAPWIWNPEKGVFLSMEDGRSVAAKAQFVEKRGLGGVALWELAGDYGWYPERRNGGGEYYMGSTLTEVVSKALRDAGPYRTGLGEGPVPREALDLTVEVTGFGVGDENYHLAPTLRITNRSGVDLPAGMEVRFQVPTSTPDNLRDAAGVLRVLRSGHEVGHNVGGLRGEFHQVGIVLSRCRGLPSGGTYELELLYYLPISGPSSYTVAVGGSTYALAFERPELAVGVPPRSGRPERGPCRDAVNP